MNRRGGRHTFKSGVSIRLPGPREPWECQACNYKPNVNAVSKQCLNCGRDYLGFEGDIPRTNITTVRGRGYQD